MIGLFRAVRRLPPHQRALWLSGTGMGFSLGVAFATAACLLKGLFA